VGNNNALNYKIYNSKNQVVVDGSSATKLVQYKNNYYQFFLNTLPTNNYYLLEITTKKKEKKYLRFKI
jgi:hypothetical protein